MVTPNDILDALEALVEEAVQGIERVVLDP